MMKNSRSRSRTASAFLLSAGLLLVFAEVAGAAEEPSASRSQEVQRLINDLGSADFETARRAAVALGSSGDTSAVPALIDAAVGDVVPELAERRPSKIRTEVFDERAYSKAVGEAAAGASGGLKAAGGAGKVDRKDFVKTEIIEIRWGVDPFLMPKFRAAAIASLGKLRSADALESLSAIYSRREDQTILTAAAEAIVRIDPDAGYELLSKDLGGNDIGRIRSAISGLALVENREVMPQLVPLLYDEAAKVDVHRAMGKRPYQETRAPVLKMLSDGDVSVVSDALDILRAQAKAGAISARTDDPELGETLAALAGDTRHRSWTMALAVMSEIGLYEDLREILCTCLESREENERGEALSLLFKAIEGKRIDGAYLDDRMIGLLNGLGEDKQSKNGKKALLTLFLAGRGAK